MSTTYCRDPECGQPVESELWAPWCSLAHAHRWLWRQRVEWTEPEPTAPSTARESAG